jgi:hypothetical protein
MQREIKTAEEIRTAVGQYVDQHGGASGSQWFVIVKVDPPVNGANWRISHSGESSSFAKALEVAEAQLTKTYSLAAGYSGRAV